MNSKKREFLFRSVSLLHLAVLNITVSSVVFLEKELLPSSWEPLYRKFVNGSIFSLPTSPISNCGALVADRMGLSGAKRQLPW